MVATEPPDFVTDVLNIPVLVVEEPVIHVRVLGAEEEHVSGPLVLVGGVHVLGNVVLRSGRF